MSRFNRLMEGTASLMSSLDELLSRGFRFIPAMECHTMLRLQKGGTYIAYRIPTSSVNEELKYVNAFMKSLAILPCEVVNRAKEDAQRGISHTILHLDGLSKGR